MKLLNWVPETFSKYITVSLTEKKGDRKWPQGLAGASQIRQKQRRRRKRIKVSYFFSILKKNLMFLNSG